jgi:L-asparaginase
MVATSPADTLVRSAGAVPDIAVTAVDAVTKGGHELLGADQVAIVQRLEEQFDDPDVVGVVVTHGTDTMEETAFLADLVHRSPAPVVFTGAQRAASRTDSDGPRNLREAILAAADPRLRGYGALIGFASKVFPGRLARKDQTLALDAFAHPDGPAAIVEQDAIRILRPPGPRFTLPGFPTTFGSQRVDLVSSHPGADRTLFDAALEAGARAIVLVGTGAGNTNVTLCEAAAEAVREGVIVAIATRVANGPVAAVYGRGGGADLARAGVISLGRLHASQARVLLAALLATYDTTEQILAEVRTWMATYEAGSEEPA